MIPEQDYSHFKFSDLEFMFRDMILNGINIIRAISCVIGI
jgi:hypothetical protein